LISARSRRALDVALEEGIARLGEVFNNATGLICNRFNEWLNNSDTILLFHQIVIEDPASWTAQKEERYSTVELPNLFNTRYSFFGTGPKYFITVVVKKQTHTLK